MPTQQFTIPDQRLQHFTEKMAELDRRARRLGGEGVSVAVVGRGTKAYPTWRRQFVGGRWETVETVREHPVSVVEVSGAVPRIERWELLARVDVKYAQGHASRASLSSFGPPKDEVRRLLNDSLDDKGRVCCAHCGTSRNRKTAYFLRRAADGAVMAVGSDCFQDFTGVDPAAVAKGYDAVLSAMAEADQIAERPEYTLFHETDWDGWTAAQRAEAEARKVPLRAFLGHVADAVSDTGWIGPARAKREGLAATWQEALARVSEGRQPSAPGLAAADRTVAWVPGMGFRSDDLWRIKRTVAEAGDGRFDCGEAEMFAKAVVEAARAAGAPLAGEWLGGVGERLDAVLECLDARYGEKTFRDRTGHEHVSDCNTYVLADASGRRVTTTTAQSLPLAPGGLYECRGTVAGREVDGCGRAVTVVQRVRVLREVPSDVPDAAVELDADELRRIGMLR